MKKAILIPVLLSICFALNLPAAEAFIKPIVNEKAKVESIIDLTADDIVVLNKKELGKKIGRKLKFKERIALWMVKKRLKKIRHASTTEVVERARVPMLVFTGLAISMIGIFFAGIILGTAGMIVSAAGLNKITKYPNQYKGKLVGFAGLLIGAVALVGAVIVIALAA